MYINFRSHYFLFDLIFLLVTASIAWHGINFRDSNGKTDFVRLIFASIALVFFVRVLVFDILMHI